MFGVSKKFIIIKFGIWLVNIFGINYFVGFEYWKIFWVLLVCIGYEVFFMIEYFRYVWFIFFGLYRWEVICRWFECGGNLGMVLEKIVYNIWVVILVVGKM